MSDPVLDALWKKVLADFDDGRAHAAFIEHCRATNRLLEAAVRYRGMAGDHARGPQAERHLAAIAALAMASLETTRTPERHDFVVLAVRLLLIVLFVAGTAALLFSLR
jgi:CHASE2 domain-containing sensor protein